MRKGKTNRNKEIVEIKLKIELKKSQYLNKNF